MQYPIAENPDGDVPELGQSNPETNVTEPKVQKPKFRVGMAVCQLCGSRRVESQGNRCFDCGGQLWGFGF